MSARMHVHSASKTTTAPDLGARPQKRPQGTTALPFSGASSPSQTLFGVQAKLPTDQISDPFEREADQVSEQIMAAARPSNTGANACSNLGSTNQPPRIQRLSSRLSANRNMGAVRPIVDRVTRSAGQPLDSSTLAFMETRFQHDFGHVRVHADAEARRSARSVGAVAFTTGHHIVFGEGSYAPATASGQKLLAHELTHVVQQNGTAGSGPVVQRQSNAELEKVEDYLSYGLFDWAVTDDDAIAALTILRGLPRIQQAEFASNGKYLDRLRSNLPEEYARELDEIENNVQSLLPASKSLDAIIDKLSYGVVDWAITDKDAIEALDLLKTLSPGPLAVALSRIDYGRLMDNLPDNRKKELIDLLAQGLRTGGTKDTEEEKDPGVALTRLTFNSDHGVLKENNEDWTTAGNIYGEPEWSITPEGKTKSVPISHNKNQNISIELGYDVAPDTAPSAPISIEGDSDVDFLKFSLSTTETGGADKRQSLTSTGKLPNRVMAVRDKHITWKMRWRNWERQIGHTGPFTIFTTISDPLDPAQATYRRMQKAVELVASSPTLDPHEIVKTIMFNWTTFNLDVVYPNEWDLAADMDTGAQCIDLVRFVQSVVKMVGAPGTAEAVVVWAQPLAPHIGIEAPWGGHGSGGMSSGLIPPYPGQPDWRAVLLDGDMRPNNYEAALKFSHGGVTRYYPGGVASVLDSADQVLRVFNCLAWVNGLSGGKYEITAVPASYRAGECVVGARHSWGGG